MHKFEDSRKREEEHNKDLDGFYSEWFEISPVTLKAQKAGIDRTWTQRKTKYRYSVEYKADEKATYTGNVFIETISVDDGKRETPGWGYTSCAQLLVYYLPNEGVAYRTSMLNVKFHIDDWAGLYPIRSAQNDGYLTWGVCVPIDEFETICYAKNQVKQGNDQ